MTQILPLDVVIRLTLCKLYELTALKGSFKVDADTIAKEIGHGVLSGFVTLALHNLAEQAFVSTFSDGKDGLMAHLTPKGAREAELDLRNPESLMHKFQRFGDQAIRDQIVEAGGVPAADRFVDKNHNSGDFENLISSLDELEQSIKFGNEAGDLFGDDRDAIAEEIGALRALLSASKIRISLALEFAQRSLGWIAEKAGTATIGELAKKALSFAITWLFS